MVESLSSTQGIWVRFPVTAFWDGLLWSLSKRYYGVMETFGVPNLMIWVRFPVVASWDYTCNGNMDSFYLSDLGSIPSSPFLSAAMV